MLKINIFRFYGHFFCKKFAYIKKMLYLCTRFEQNASLAQSVRASDC